MPTAYCYQSGHRVVYSGAKPSHCPTCNSPMEMVAPPPVARASTAPVAAEPRRPRGDGFWDTPSLPVMVADGAMPAETGDFTPDGEGIVVRDEDGRTIRRRPRAAHQEMSFPTVKQFAEAGADPVRAEAPKPLQGVKRVTAADLVQDMLKNAPPAAAPSPICARPTRSRRTKKAAA